MSGVALSLSGKVALITGGSRGIGAECVRLFREAGAKVAFNYRAARVQAEALVAECGNESCVAIEQDLSSSEDGRALVARAVETFGRLDCLVVNHGIWPPGDAPIASMSDAQWRKTLGVNLDSVFGLVQAAVTEMQKQGRSTDGSATGHVVLVSSTAGQRGEAFHADYAVTKGAIISLTKSLSSELAGEGIYVNCVAPGWVATEMSASALSDPVTSQKIFGTIPLGRVATPREIAGPILFLCTPFAGFMSGEIVNVNGGAVLVG
jgi:3-oxoacyl-[acyl-carrier protein] reductase